MSLVSVPGYSAVLGIGTLELKVSRLSGVSPCTVACSVEGAAWGNDEHESWALFGFYWDAGDPGNGSWPVGKNKLDKNISIGGPMFAHTYIVADGGGSVDFIIKVNIESPTGEKAQLSTTITVQAQDDYYSAANTIAVSADLSTGADWTTYDKAVPSGAAKRNTFPPFAEIVSGKRFMFYNNDAAAWGDFRIQMGTSNSVFTYFGDHATGTVKTESGNTVTFTSPDKDLLLIDAQDETDYDGVIYEGVFAGGTLHAVSDVITLTGGTTITVDAESGGVVTQFTVDSSADTAGHAQGAAINQASSTGSGINFSLTPHHPNLVQVDPHGGTITDSANGLGSFVVDRYIEITGTASNNFRFKIKSVAAGEITVTDGMVEVTTEAAAGSAVLTEHHKDPEVGLIEVSVAVDSASYNVTDANVAALGWCENLTFDRLRIEKAKLPQSYLNIGFHRCDFDQIDNTTGGWIAGSTQASYSWDNPGILDPANVPWITGFYVSECVFRMANAAGILGTAGANVQVAMFDGALPNWVSIIGSSFKNSQEHLTRFMGWYRIIQMHNDYLGNTGIKTGAGGKHVIAHRGEGYNTTYGDLLGRDRGDIIFSPAYAVATIDEKEADAPSCRYCLIQDNYISPGAVGDSTSHIQVSMDDLRGQLLEDAIIRDCEFTSDPLTNNINVRLAGRWLTSQEHTYSSSGRSQDVSADKSLDVINLGSGTPSLNPIDIDGDSIPVPDAP